MKQRLAIVSGRKRLVRSRAPGGGPHRLGRIGPLAWEPPQVCLECYGKATTMQPVLLSLFRLIATSLTASCLHAPMSWSPDGQWLAYTMVEPADTPTLKPGWLYDSGALFPARSGSFLPLDERPKAGLPRYRIWATERVSGVSVLIADAAYPLSSPAWGPGRTYLVLLPVCSPIARNRPESVARPV